MSLTKGPDDERFLFVASSLYAALLFQLLLPQKIFPIFPVRINVRVLDLNRGMLDAVFAFQRLINRENNTEGLNVRTDKHMRS